MSFFSLKKQAPVQIYNRETNAVEKENVFEEKFMDIFYGTSIGRCITRACLSRKFFSKIYGRRQKQPASTRHIRPFIEKYDINIDELEKPVSKFQNFNEFFTRKIRSSARPIAKDPETLIAPADGRLLVYTLKDDLILPVKGRTFTLGELLGDDEAANVWQGGCCVKLRLAPSDYHRFCYIDSGFHGPVIHVDGKFHSVSPLALRHNLKILHGNDREYVLFDTDNFGKVAHIDIGAMVVGKIHQHFRQGTSFLKGEEKGYFEFGGSTIILLFESGKVLLDQDILDYSRNNIETLVQYGSAIGKKVRRL